MILSFFCLLFAFNGTGLPGSTPDFESEILPIFERHCFDCHGNGNREGELVLQTIAGVRAGGHTGNPLLAEQLDQSELFLRVTSTSDGYRMPKKGESLSEEEIQTLASWIQTTSPVGEPVAVKNFKAPANSAPLPWLGGLTPGQQYQVIGTAVAIALLLIYLAVRAVQTRKKRLLENKELRRPAFSPVGWAVRGLFAASLSAAVVGLGYYYLLAAELQQQVDTLKSRTRAGIAKKPVVAESIGPDYLPLPPSPMHPPRLGGRYYRGNDERDPALFNGGFYRTATIDLQLVGADGKSVKWNDAVPEKLFVEIVIERAAEATTELFSERVRAGVVLLHFDQDGGDGAEFKFEVEEAGQRWRAVVPLVNGGLAEGMIYLMYGVDHAVRTSTGEASPRPHFGIRYQIEVVNERIGRTSSLWMGSMYTLGGRVLVPDRDRVLLDRWFDWRPIPEIKGRGSSDPKLLGLPEHE